VNAARPEISRQRERLSHTFGRITDIHEDATETRADFAKYLCVRVSGYLETSISGLLMAFAANQSSTRVSRYVGADLKRFQNASTGKILELFGRFDEAWRDDLKAYLADEKSDAIGTIIANRHKIAHGEDSDLTYVRVRAHWEIVQRIVEHFADLVDPPGP